MNQCVGSSQGGGIQIICDPVQSTTGATITQCNGSVNGGGLVAGSTCTATGTQSAALSRADQPVQRFRQWRRSVHRLLGEYREQPGGGRDAGPDRDAGGAGSTPRVTPPTTDTTTGVDGSGTGSIQIALLAISLVALIVLVATLRPPARSAAD